MDYLDPKTQEPIYSFEQAAKIIGCNFRMIYKYQKYDWLNVIYVKRFNDDLQPRMQPMLNRAEIDRIIKLRSRPENSITAKELSEYFHYSVSSINHFLNVLDIEPLNGIRSKQPSGQTAYYPKTAQNAIREMLFKRHKKASYLKIDEPNTDVIYNPKTDYSMTKLIKALSPIHQLNTRTIAQWVRYNRIDYCIDGTGKFYLNEAQFQKLKHDFRNIPGNVVCTQPELIKKFKTNNQTFYNFRQNYPTNPIRVLGFNYQFYTQAEVDKIEANWKKYAKTHKISDKKY